MSILCTSTILVFGADCGGSATRAVVATPDGRVVGRGRAGAGNPATQPPAEAASALVAATREALAGHDPARVAGAVVGLAGRSALDRPAVAAIYLDAWRATGLTCPLRTVGDAVVAFAAGSPAPSGTVLIAGTGAVAVQIVERAVGRTVDGLGWLLGDEGGGFWLGLEAARLTARALTTGRRAGGPLVDAVSNAVFRAATPPVHTRPAPASPGKPVEPAAGSTGTAADGFVTAFYALPRDRVAGLAPLVLDAARVGDRDAHRLIEAAADRLAATVRAVPPGRGPLVLAGGLLTGPPELRAALAARLGRRPVSIAGDPAAAAAWLAARELVPTGTEHGAFVTPPA
ncbi:N-acetylglucosamine kinase-like BadF-type ATPase [Micromonospora sp. M71_S20]|uniref:N-acetylglucosamine kinase n=1 Tax=Micromonospora sp. M71_S20 TaxID=592872 RepID=UPI000EB28F33|nr:BadF/BadG/BcrA/BcrD ATPase family protein [Micromonospora sp. M71_S20]RLK09721.1 N-acetylglucosamine kinase-like BadF-type ATPase [Micromonospora sp. M71_S20]